MRAGSLVLLCVLALVLVASGASAVRLRPSSFAAAAAAPKQAAPLNTRPIIGVFSLANSDDDNETGSTVTAAYVKWFEQAGARVAPIPFNAPQAELTRLFNGINGLLFTGGGLDLGSDTFYFRQAQFMFNLAKAANDRGDYFPLWGTCQGFQLLHLLVALPPNHNEVLVCDKYDSWNLPLALDFSDVAKSSQLFGPAQRVPAVWDGSDSMSLFEAFGTQPITMNLHKCGVSTDDFFRNAALTSFFTVLSTNTDLKNQTFISTVEGKKYPFFAVQWHPERTQFEWDAPELLAHTPMGAASSAYVAHRWVMLARQSQHKFRTDAEEQAALIYNFLPTDTRDESGSATTIYSQQVYQLRFNYGKKDKIADY